MALSQQDINAISSAVISKIAEYGTEAEDETYEDEAGDTAPIGEQMQRFSRTNDLAAEDVTRMVRYARENKITDGTLAVARYREARAQGLIRD